MGEASALTTIVADAMSCVTTIFNFVMGQTGLAVLAVGYPVVRLGASALKRLIRV